MLQGQANFVDEFRDTLVVSTDTGKADISDFIHSPQVLHNHLANDGGADLFVIVLKEDLFDLVHDLLDLFGRDRTLVAGLFQTGGDFFAIVRDVTLVFLDHGQVEAFAGPLVGGKTTSTGQAHATSTDGLPAIAGTRVNDFISIFCTEGAFQGAPRI